MATPAWISLGSNLGDREATLDAAVAALAETPGIAVRSVSTYHETAPVGGPAGQGAFLNAAARLETTLEPLHLLDVMQAIEARAGRVRAVRWGERTLDLDLLIFGAKFLDTLRLKLPHPRLAFRRFVLGPLTEIAPAMVDTMTRRTIADLLARLDRRPRLLALAGPPGPSRSSVFRGLIEGLDAFAIGEAEIAEAPDLANDPGQRSVADFERKAAAVSAALWRRPASRVDWIVSDYCLDREVARIRSSIRHFLADPAWGKSRTDTFYAGIRRVQEAEKLALEPTLAVALPDSEWERRPGHAAFPVLWPESNKPEAIVAEILATCRGIEGA